MTRSYFAIAIPAAAALYVLSASLMGADSGTYSWVHPFAAAFLVSAALVGAAVVRMLGSDAAKKEARAAREKARNDLTWNKMTDAEKDVIIELRKRTEAP